MFNRFNGPLTEAELADAARAADMVEKWEEKRLEVLERARNQRFALKNRINMKNMVAVHLTNTFPKGGVIKTSNQFTKEIHGREIRFPRHSIHFALNGPVGSHNGGNWDGCKYAIIIPLNKIAKRIVTLNPVDTWVIGKLELPRGSVVLVPEGETKSAGNARVIPTQGNMYQAVKEHINQQGLPLARISMWGWDFDAENRELAQRLIMGGLNPLNGFDGGDFSEYSKRLGYETRYHTHSILSEIEEVFNNVALILPKFYNNMDVIGYPEDAIKKRIKRVKELKQELSAFTKKREKFGYTTTEKQAYEKIAKVLDHCITELKLYVHKVIRAADQIGKQAKKVEDLTEEVQRLTLREQVILAQFKEALGEHDQKEISKLLRKLGKVEKRLYQKYTTVKERLDELSKDHNFTVDISDLIEELDVYEAYLARYLSLGVGLLAEMAEKEKWHKIEEVLPRIERYILNAEAMLKDMHDVIESRVTKFKEEF